jgi:hypothetical protein
MRASLFAALVAVAATAAPAARAETPDAMPGTPVHVEFIQQAASMTFDGKTLRLKSPGHATIVSAQGAEPSTGTMDNAAFVDIYGQLAAADSKDAPNAMVVLAGSDEEPPVVELMAPRLDGGDLVYDATVIEGTLPESHEGVTVVIDPWVYVAPRRVWRAPVVVVPPVVVAPRVVLGPRCHFSPYFYGRVCRY